MQFSSIYPIDMTYLSGPTIPGHSGPGRIGNEEVLRIPQSSSITGTSPSDCLVWYRGHSWEGVLSLCREAIGVFYSPSQLGDGRSENLTTYCSDTVMPYITKTQQTDGQKDAFSPSLPKKGDRIIAETYQGITLTSIAAKIYNVLLRNHIEPEIEKILRKNQNGF